MTFQPRLWPTFFSIIGLGLLLTLGTWQAKRYLSKSAFEEARDARIELSVLPVQSPQELADGEVDFRQIEIEGIWDRERLFLIRHRTFQSEPGFWVVNALLVPSENEPTALLVNRGWIPYQNGRERAAELLDALPVDTVRLTGLVHELEYVVRDDDLRTLLHQGGDVLPDGVITVSTYDTVAMNLATPVDGFDRDIVLTLSPDAQDTSYPIASYDHITEPYLTAETHFGYALTWYLLALALIAIWIAGAMGTLTSASYQGERNNESESSQ